MKKFVFAIVASLTLAGCNRQVLDLKYKFSKAYVRWPDGSMKVISVSKWRDYQNSDQIQVIDEKGTVYLFHSANIVLVNE